jgi:hypothetical protein
MPDDVRTKRDGLVRPLNPLPLNPLNPFTTGTTVIPRVKNGGAILMVHSHESRQDAQEQEIVTEPLTSLQLRECLPDVIRFFSVAGFDTVVVMYGWGSKLQNDKLWQPLEIAATQIQEFAARSEKQGFFEFGKSDLIIQTPGKEASLTLCHESDVHFVSRDISLLEKFVEWWRGKGVGLSSSSRTVTGPVSWTKIE